MTEDPIKLFGSRAERFPEPGDFDRALGAAKAMANLIPIFGPIAIEVLTPFMTGVERRRNEWFKELADGVRRARGSVPRFPGVAIKGR